jgi:hypothetical protein
MFPHLPEEGAGEQLKHKVSGWGNPKIKEKFRGRPVIPHSLTFRPRPTGGEEAGSALTSRELECDGWDDSTGSADRLEAHRRNATGR